MTKSISLILSMIVIVGFATTLRAGSDRVYLHQIKDFRALSEQELVIETLDGRFFLAKIFNRCFGLRIAEDLAFITHGSNAIDSFSSVVLPDGTRCRFAEFEPYDPEAMEQVTTNGSDE